MKLPLLIPALAAVLGLALAGAPITAQAQTTNAAPAAAPTASTKKASKPTEYRDATLTAIDTTANTVTYQTTTKKDGAKTTTLAIAPTTKFLKDGKTATLADFAVGDKVSGSYTKDASGALTAYSLHKGTKPAKAAKATKPAAAPASN